MEELFKFLSEQYIIPFYLIVWLVAMSRYHTYFDTPMKYYPMYLMYTFLTELLGYFIKFHDEFQVVSDSNYDWYNVIIYNIYSYSFDINRTTIFSCIIEIFYDICIWHYKTSNNFGVTN